MQNWRRAILSGDSCQTQKELSESLSGYPDEKWVHYSNPKGRKSWGLPGGHAATSTPRPNIHGSKVMLCVWLGEPSWHVAPSDFHLTHLAQWHTAWLTSNSARMKKGRIELIDSWILSKDENFFASGFTCCPRDGPKW
nr:transposase [Hymenolepis microstoma]